MSSHLACRVLAFALGLVLISSTPAETLPDGAIARLGTTRLRHGGPITAITFSPDGKTLVSSGQCGGDFCLKVWDAETGAEKRQIPLKGCGGTVLFAQDGNVALCRTAKHLSLWDVLKEQEIATVPYRPRQEGRLVLSGDGKTLALAVFDTVMVGKFGSGNWMDGGIRKKEERQDPDIPDFALSTDGKTLIACGAEPGGQSYIRVSEASRGDLHTLTPDTEVRAVAVSPDGKSFASAHPGKAAVKIWDVKKGELIRDCTEASGTPEWLVYARDGKSVAVGYGRGVVKVFDVGTGKETGSVGTGENLSRHNVAVSPDGKSLAFGGADGVISIKDISTGKERLPAEGHRHEVLSVAFTPDGKALIAGCGDGTARLWEVPSGKPLHVLTGHKQGITAVAVAPDGTTVSTSAQDGTIRVWDRSTGKVEGIIITGTVNAHGLAYSSDGKRLYSYLPDAPQAVVAWDPATAARVVRGGVPSSDFARGGALAVSSDGEAVAFGTSRALVTDADGEGATPLPSNDNTSSELTSLAFTPGWPLLVGGSSEGTVHVWEHTKDSLVRRIALEAKGAATVACSPDGKMFAVGAGDGLVLLHETSTGKERARYRGHQGAVKAVAFSPDGKVLASAGADTTVMLWDVTAPPKARVTPLTAEQVGGTWDALADVNAEYAYTATLAFMKAPELAVPFLGKQIPTVRAEDKNRVARLLADLFSNNGDASREAAAELEKLGGRAEPVLRKAWADGQFPGQRSKLQAVLDSLSPWGLKGEGLRELRAVEILERIGTPEAREVLEILATGARDAWLTREATASLDRLKARTPKP